MLDYLIPLGIGVVVIAIVAYNLIATRKKNS